MFAELAGVRTAVDGYFGGNEETDFMVLIGPRFHLDYEAPFACAPAACGSTPTS